MKNHLHILWTTDNLITTEHLIMMYEGNSLRNEWWKKVTVIIWGAQKLLTCENESVRKMIAELTELSMEFFACLTCANQLDTKEKLEGYGIEVKRWRPLLTEITKADEKLITI